MTQATLTYTEKTLENLLLSLCCDKTLVVSDIFNYNRITDQGLSAKIILATNSSILCIDKLAQEHIEHRRVVGVGGCTALDVARMLAQSADFIAIPTILSTPCISSDKSILTDCDGHKVAVKVKPPLETIISYPTLETGDTLKWLASGFADCLARISTAIGYNTVFDNKNTDRLNRIISYVPETFDLLNWVESKYKADLKRETITTLAKYCHEESIRTNLGAYTFAGTHGFGESQEHVLCYAINSIDFNNKKSTQATHGELVSIGTLFATQFLKEHFNIDTPHTRLINAYKTLDLPLTLNQLEDIGVDYQLLENAICSPRYSQTYMGKYLNTKESIRNFIDRVYPNS